MRRILIVSSDPEVRESVRGFLERAGYEAGLSEGGSEVMDIIGNEDYSIILVDAAVESPDSLELAAKIRASGYTIPVFIIADNPPRDFKIAAFRAGAYDFLGAPPDPEIAQEIIRRALERYDLELEIKEYRQEAVSQELASEIICQSPVMAQSMELVRKVSRTDVTVLITGESGAGKELFAKAIHATSDRKKGSFVSINCAAIPETLLEAELFGYEKGAFTGAARQHIGKFERAEGGTVFLDEIAELSPGLQAKLLRVLQEKEIERLGGSQPIRINIRLISATNKDLDFEVSTKRFRDDLLYRVRVFEIRVPALRERKEDIPLLAERFLKKYAGEIGKDVRGFDKLALNFLLTYPWPGNVREMENLIQRAIILEDKRSILRGDTLLSLMSGRQSGTVQETSAKERVLLAKEQEEKKVIMEALIRSHWKRQQAADILGISRKSLFNKIKKYGI